MAAASSGLNSLAGYSTASTRFLAATMCSTCARNVGAIHVAEPHGVRSADLVAIAGADAAAGRADVLAVRRALVERAVLGEMPRENHIEPVADPQIVRMARAALGQLVELLDHAGRIQHDARGDDARDAGRENAAGQQRKLVNLVADDDGVAGVRPALVADDEVMLAGQDVDDLALGFVAPLQTDNASAGHGRIRQSSDRTVRIAARKNAIVMRRARCETASNCPPIDAIRSKLPGTLCRPPII